MVLGLVGPFDGGDIRRAAFAPVQIRIAGVDPHRLGDELDPIPDANTVIPIQGRQLTMAGMKDGANGVAMVGDGGGPRPAAARAASTP